MQVVAKLLRARASEYSSYFCQQFEQRLNFASTFKLNGTIRYPPYLEKKGNKSSVALQFLSNLGTVYYNGKNLFTKYS